MAQRSRKPKRHEYDVKPSAIVDNRTRQVGNFLRERIEDGAVLSVVSAYFTIYAWEALRDELERVGSMRFLYGEPRGVGAMDPVEDDGKAFRLTEDGGIELKRVLKQKPLARTCAEWIGKCVSIRTVAQANFLHGKFYHVERADGDTAALVGSSNLTHRGLGYGAAPNIELNLEVRNRGDRESLLQWFDELWADETLARDAKQEVLNALSRLGKDYAPEFVYYKTLFHVFENRLKERDKHDKSFEGVHLHDSEIWKRLYEFQKDGATNAINRLLRYNGCIVADSVGLGKTWTALAVIKYFEARNERVLVLCPKKLKENWIRYTSWANDRNNPLAEDRLNYTVLAHTDLSRYKGKSGDVDLARFNWGAFDLIVIDESHNFRNEGRDRKNDTGAIIQRSRYNRLLEEVIKDGIRTKVLMLSATPVNTTLRDLRNQVYLITEKRRDTFRETLGISDVQSLFGVAQRQFLEWERKRHARSRANKDELLESFGANVLALLDALTLARSRSHVHRFYPEVEQQIGGFPKRAKPENVHPATDGKGELSYDDLHERIGKFRLAIYMPSEYLKNKSELDEEKERLRFDQRDREHWLIGMMRVNLLKRLESSVHAFTLTMGRILEKMEGCDRQIEAWQERGEDARIETLPDEDEEDEEFTFGKGRQYRLGELDLDRWKHDLREDRKIFSELYGLAKQVTVARDAKLAELRRILKRKVKAAPLDKDDRPNRKALVFTTFADTAKYLYKELGEWARDELCVHAALVIGSGGNRTTLDNGGPTGFTDVLQRFAPRAQDANLDGEEEIDLLIATDCLSEGQNLQDCDFVVNYDIHWNPVRLMQRFGRIDRIGSRNREVAMTNFWPTKDLERYLDLKNRVKARMALADATATGFDDPLNAEEGIQLETSFRGEQLKRLREEILDLEEVEGGVTMSDFTLDDFIAELLKYIQQNRKALEEAPFGIHAVTDTGPKPGLSGDKTQPVQPGAIFCLRQKTTPEKRTPNNLQPYFLVYVRDDGTVRYTFQQAKQVLTLFRKVAGGRQAALVSLVDAFDRETQHGQKMGAYEKLLDSALRSISGTFRVAELRQLVQDRGAKLTKQSEQPNTADDFELVTWLAIRSGK